jgi:hypothetical protein
MTPAVFSSRSREEGRDFSKKDEQKEIAGEEAGGLKSRTISLQSVGWKKKTGMRRRPPIHMMVAGQTNRANQQLDLGYGNGRCLANLLETALLGESLLALQSSKSLEWQNGFLQPFDGNLLEKPRALSDDEDLLVGINTQIDILPDPV